MGCYLQVCSLQGMEHMLSEQNKRNRDHVAINHLNKDAVYKSVFLHLSDHLHFQKAFFMYLIIFLPLVSLFYIKLSTI